MGGLGLEGSDSSRSPSSSVDVGGIDPTMWEPQEVGASRSHTDAFKKVRDQRIDRFVVETNKLLIRLDKLIANDAPMDPSKRKGKSLLPFHIELSLQPNHQWHWNMYGLSAFIYSKMRNV